MQQSLVKTGSWIIDGNYGSTIDIRLKASDTIIYLDINRFICLFRAVKRTVTQYGKHRADMGVGCNERFNLDFVRWIYGYSIKKNPEIIEKLSKLEPNVQVHILKSQSDVDMFIRALER